MERTAADIEREIDDGDVILHQVAGQAAQDPAAQYDQRQAIMMQAEGFIHFFDGKRRVSLDLAISLGAHLAGSRGERGGVFELGHQTVDRSFHFSTPSTTSACGSSVRTSKIEIMGSERMNRKNRKKNRPMVPTYVATSQIVGQYNAQEDGKKSRDRLTTM